MSVQTKQSSEIYHGWGEILQAGSNGDELYLAFPLNEEKTYFVSSSSDGDMVLPPDLQAIKVLIHVNAKGKVDIENASSPESNGLLALNDNQLNANVKTTVSERSTIKIGSLSFKYKRIETPGSSQLKILTSNLNCAICLRFLDNPHSLSCQHVFCQSCIAGLRAAASSARSAANQRLAALQGIEDQNNLTCGVCRKLLPMNDTGRPQKVLSEVCKQFQDIFDGRPICSMCNNQRWLMHGNDYYYCETCRKDYCPLCALDFHREHVLRNKFTSTLENSREFANKSTQVKQDLANVMKIVEENKSNIRKAVIWLDNFKSELKELEQTVDKETKPTATAYSKILALESPRIDDKVESERAKTLTIFLTQLNLLRNNTMPTLKVLIDGKVNVMNRAQNESERPLSEKEQSSKTTPSSSLAQSSSSSTIAGRSSPNTH